ncbi:unnamed protein product [Lupinus luteus]|uniref:CN hydrolase domain-containing protein n=1 Tax=Lupinus luteus TaxID=3873 RepID=A0AAV1YM03_LUPLU
MPLLRTAMYAKGVEIYCAPTADSRDLWQASMTHIALEGGCFVLSANQFCRRKDYPPPPEYVFADTEEDLTPDSIVSAGAWGSITFFYDVRQQGTTDRWMWQSACSSGFQDVSGITCQNVRNLGEIARAKFDFDVVGHYSRSEVLSLVVKDHPTNPVTFTSTSTKIED